MKEKSTKILLIINAFILLILLFILVRKEPVYVSSETSSNNPSSSGSSFESVELGDNLIAIIHSDTFSTSYGEIVVLEYDTELNSFNEVSDYDIFLKENNTFTP